MSPNRLPGKDSVVAGAANRLDQLLGCGERGIENHSGAMGHQIDARRGDAGRGPQSRFHVVLARGAGHAEHGKSERFLSVEATNRSKPVVYDSKCAV